MCSVRVRMYGIVELLMILGLRLFTSVFFSFENLILNSICFVKFVNVLYVKGKQFIQRLFFMLFLHLHEE